MAQEIGIINEIGDMGLGFDILEEKDAKALEAAQNPEPKTTVINENENK
jgi:hypothetical protein